MPGADSGGMKATRGRQGKESGGGIKVQREKLPWHWIGCNKRGPVGRSQRRAGKAELKGTTPGLPRLMHRSRPAHLKAAAAHL